MVNFIESLRMLALKMALQISSDSVYEDSFALLTGWSINYLLGFWMRDLDCYVTTRIEFWHLQKKIWLTATAETKKSNISSEPHLLFLSSKSINWSQYLTSWGNLIEPPTSSKRPASPQQSPVKLRKVGPDSWLPEVHHNVNFFCLSMFRNL